ncbi:MAG: hypothetical protein IMF11_16480 [Proteobacteria bacterium]|nr:hypothetical protein [Pseudomonadota bacterium]
MNPQPHRDRILNFNPFFPRMTAKIVLSVIEKKKACGSTFSTCAVKKLYKTNHENTKVRNVLKANAAKHEIKPENPPANAWVARELEFSHTVMAGRSGWCPSRDSPFFVFSIFRAFVIILFWRVSHEI